MTSDPLEFHGGRQPWPEPPEFIAALRYEVGDEAYDSAWQDVIARHGPILRRYVASLAGDVGDADLDDLLQRVWERAYRGIGQFRNAGPLRAWLFTIARNTFLNHYREMRYADRVIADVRADDYEAVADSAVERRLRDAESEAVLTEWLHELSERHRALVRMRLDGYSNTEIALALGYRSAGTVATTLGRIHKRLSVLLGSEAVPSTMEPEA